MSFGSLIRNQTGGSGGFISLADVQTSGPVDVRITGCRTQTFQNQKEGTEEEKGVLILAGTDKELVLSSKSALVDIAEALGDPGDGGENWIGQTIQLAAGKGRWSPNATLRIYPSVKNNGNVAAQPAAPVPTVVEDDLPADLPADLDDVDSLPF